MSFFLTGDENGFIKRTKLGSKIYEMYGPTVTNRVDAVVGLQVIYEPNHLISLRKNGLIQLWDIKSSCNELSEIHSTFTDFTDLLGLKLYKKNPEPTIISYAVTGDVNISKCIIEDDSMKLGEVGNFQVKSPLSSCDTCLDGIAFGGRENDLQIYDHESLQLIWKSKNVLNDKLNLRQPIWITALEFLRPNIDSVSSGAHIATGTGYKQIRFYDTLTNQRPVQSMEIGEYRVTAIKSASTTNEQDNKKLYVADTAGGLSLWDLRMFRKLSTLKGCVGSIRDIQISELQNQLICVGLDRTLHVYNMNTNKLVHKSYMKTRMNCCVIIEETNPNSSSNNKKNKHKEIYKNDDDDNDDEEDYNEDPESDDDGDDDDEDNLEEYDDYSDDEEDDEDDEEEEPVVTTKKSRR